MTHDPGGAPEEPEPEPEEPEPEPEPQGPFVRREVGGLGSDDEQWDPVMLAYAEAVRTMQARPASDPTSWDYQAGIHGRGAPPMRDLFSTCEHANWHFLDWHRMYLVNFEKIVRAAVIANGGPTDWALPFWDYSRPGTAKALPWVFRQQQLPDGTPNPLFVADRNASRNAGAPISDFETSNEFAFSRSAFVGVGWPESGFGGVPLQLGGAPGSLELNPHNSIHVAIGGWMSNPMTAGQDPIFWLHHCNIDRVWELWNRQDAAHTNPTDADWLTNSFEFFDDTGTKVATASSNVLSIEADLNYTYEGLPAPAVAPPPGGFGIAPEEGSDVPDDTPAEMVGGTEDPIVLGGEAADAVFAVTPSRPSGFGIADDEPPTRVHLVVDNVVADAPPSTNYLAILDMGDPSDRDDYTVGVVSFFGVESTSRVETERGGHAMRVSLDITDAVARLRARGLWNEDAVRVRFEPTAPVEADEPTQISIGRVSVFYS